MCLIIHLKGSFHIIILFYFKYSATLFIVSTTIQTNAFFFGKQENTTTKCK